jgi:hypothetical protein
MNTEDIKPIKEEPQEVEGSKKEETLHIDRPKQGWFFPNIAEGLPFGIEAETREEAEAANTKYLETQKKHKESN